MSIAWDELDLYRNRDYLSRSYAERHKKDLAADKAWQIIAALEQGKQYLDAAPSVAPIARPLLLYYGVLTLSRAVILFLSPDRVESDLSPLHGITHKHWGDTLRKGPDAMRELQMATQKGGTFLELVEATKNADWFAPDRTHLRDVGATLMSPTPLPNNFDFTFREIVERVPELSNLYEKVFRESNECFEGGAYSSSTNDQPINISVMAKGAEVRHKIDDFLILLQAAKKSAVTVQVSTENQKQVWTVTVDLTQGGTPEDLRVPVNCYGARSTRNSIREQYFIWPIRDKYSLSLVARTFLLSYFMGTLARYYPSVWMSGLGQDGRTLPFPLLNASVSYVHEIFPILVEREFKGSE